MFSCKKWFILHIVLEKYDFIWLYIVKTMFINFIFIGMVKEFKIKDWSDK